MSNPKRQHYIPKMLLKHFADDKGQLSSFANDAPEKGVDTERNPKSLSYEKHLYTRTKLDGSKDYSTEKSLSEIESKADPIVCKMVAQIE